MLALAKANHQAILNMDLGGTYPHPLASAAADRIIAAATRKAA